MRVRDEGRKPKAGLQIESAMNHQTRSATIPISISRSRPISPQLIKAVVAVVEAFLIFGCGFLSLLALNPTNVDPQSPVLKLMVFTPWISVVVFYMYGAYADQRIFSPRSDVKVVIKSWLAVSAMLFLLGYGLDLSGEDYVGTWVAVWFASVLVTLFAARSLTTMVMTSLAERGYISQRAVIVGAGPMGQRLAAHFTKELDLRTKVIGFIDDRRTRIPPVIEGHPVIGTTSDIVSLVRQEQIEQVFVALPWSAEQRLKTILGRLAVLPVHVKLAPELINFHYPHKSVTSISGLPLLHVYDRPISGWSSFLKSLEDRVIAMALVFLTLPLLAVIALIIRINSPGPILFKQKRYGFNDKLIEVLKFRTMHHHQADAHAAVQTTKDDPRVTGIGRFLRRTSLDELPQLFNVLKGDMSIVGPRPHAIATKAAGALFEDVVNDYASRHRVRPGITGWAQVNGWRGETDTVEKLEKRIEHDLYYIENWSIGFDLMIILRTIVAIFRDPNAY